jgi:hypothetical protein
MTNIELSITLPTLRIPELGIRGLHLAILNCYRGESRAYPWKYGCLIGIHPRKEGKVSFSRVALDEASVSVQKRIWA